MESVISVDVLNELYTDPDSDHLIDRKQDATTPKMPTSEMPAPETLHPPRREKFFNKLCRVIKKGVGIIASLLAILPPVINSVCRLIKTCRQSPSEKHVRKYR